MSGVEIVFRRDLGGTEVTFAMSGVAIADVATAAAALAQATDREWAKTILRDTIVDWLAAKKSLDTHDATVREYRVGRARDRAAMLAAFQESYPAGKRVPFAPSKAQREQLAAHDRETEQKLAEFAAAKDRLQAALPDLDGKIARLKQRIAGADMIEMLEEDRRAMMPPLPANAAE